MAFQQWSKVMADQPILDDSPEGGFDGIHEYDNPCPMWWSLIFLGTFIFSIQYMLFFHVGNSGWTLDEAYQNAKVENLKMRFAQIGELKPDEATMIKYMGEKEKDWLDVGASVFKGNCKSCHGDNGSGLVGPNLTDDYYKNVKQLTDIPRVVSEGAANLTMPAWRDRLHPNEIVLVSAYVASLRGKNLPGKRGPEGNLIPPWPKTPASEAAKPADKAPAKPEPAASDSAKPAEGKKS